MLCDARQFCRHAHDAGPDSEAERQDGAGDPVVQAIGGPLGKAHLGCECGAQSGLEERRRFVCEPGGDGASGCMEGDGDAIAAGE